MSTTDFPGLKLLSTAGGARGGNEEIKTGIKANYGNV